MRHDDTERPGRRPGGRGGGRRGHGWHGGESGLPAADGAAAWLTGRLPEKWFTGPPEVTVDRDEILVVGSLSDADLPASGDPSAGQREQAEAGRISRFREDTREERIAIAREGQDRYGRAFAWGAACGGTRELFTTLSVPVMTRLRQPERQVLDTLVDAGVARTRSEALAWCVHLVGQNTGPWLSDLREALGAVESVRRGGPSAG